LLLRTTAAAAKTAHGYTAAAPLNPNQLTVVSTTFMTSTNTAPAQHTFMTSTNTAAAHHAAAAHHGCMAHG